METQGLAAKNLMTKHQPNFPQWVRGWNRRTVKNRGELCKGIVREEEDKTLVKEEAIEFFEHGVPR